MNHRNKPLTELTDREIVDLYSQWSEAFWCAGFIDPTPHNLCDFMDWLHEDYELDLIRRVRALTTPIPLC